MGLRHIFAVILVIFVLFSFSACKKVSYVCADGKVVDEKEACAYNKLAKITQKDSEKFGSNYVNAYAKAQTARATLVSSYASKGDFFVTFIYSPKDADAYETLVKVDGVTGQVSCEDNCAYVPNSSESS